MWRALGHEFCDFLARAFDSVEYLNLGQELHQLEPLGRTAVEYQDCEHGLLSPGRRQCRIFTSSELMQRKIDLRSGNGSIAPMITPRGRAHFMRMLREPAQPVFVFDESQVKMYFADRQPEIALEHMERSRRDDEERTAILAQMVAEMRRSGASTVRRFVIELGYEIVSAKARVLARLCSQLKRELQVKRRATSRPKSRIAAVATVAPGK